MQPFAILLLLCSVITLDFRCWPISAVHLMAAVNPNKPREVSDMTQSLQRPLRHLEALFLSFLHDIHFLIFGRATDCLRLDSGIRWHPGTAGGG